MTIELKRLDSSDWDVLSEKAHLVVFNEERPHWMNRIDYTMMFTEEGSVLGYITVKELDSESVYWQYGGVFPNAKNTPKSFECFSMAIKYSKDFGYKRVSMLVKNNNFPMLKFAISTEFMPIGVRTLDGDVLVEFYKDLQRSN